MNSKISSTEACIKAIDIAIECTKGPEKSFDYNISRKYEELILKCENQFAIYRIVYKYTDHCYSLDFLMKCDDDVFSSILYSGIILEFDEDSPLKERIDRITKIHNEKSKRDIAFYNELIKKK